MGERKQIQNAGGKVKALGYRVRAGLFKVFEFLLPSGITCVSCGRELGGGDNKRYSMCEGCLKLLPFRTGHYCLRCGRGIDDGTLCKNCEVAIPPYDGILSPFEYDGFPRKMIITQKEYNATYLYPITARFMADIFSAMGAKADGVCYVPTYAKAARRRGSDHTRRVAEYFAKEVKLPIYHALKRNAESGDQTEFNRMERFANVKGAFSLSDKISEIPPQGSRVVLIDDVVTTGATVSECTLTLKKFGIKEVLVLSLARR